jgi:hypothetical protein
VDDISLELKSFFGPRAFGNLQRIALNLVSIG